MKAAKAAALVCLLLATGPAALAAGSVAGQRTPEESARIAAVVAPTTDFTQPETFEPLPGGATTSQQAVKVNAFSHSSPNMSLHRDLDFKIGHALFRRLWLTSPSSTTSAAGLGPLFKARMSTPLISSQ